ncbi:hypothetical protein BTHI11S_02846 [Bosea thiooxidans]
MRLISEACRDAARHQGRPRRLRRSRHPQRHLAVAAEGRDPHGRRHERRRQVDAGEGHRRAAAARLRRDHVRSARPAAARDRGPHRRRHRLRAAGRQRLRLDEYPGEPAGRRRRARPGAAHPRALRSVSAARRTQARPGRVALGRRAPAARLRARPDDAPAPDDPRRADRGAGSCQGGRGLRPDQTPARARRLGPGRRAACAPVSGDLRQWLHPRRRQGRARGRCRSLLDDPKAAELYLGQH